MSNGTKPMDTIWQLSKYSCISSNEASIISKGPDRQNEDIAQLNVRASFNFHQLYIYVYIICEISVYHLNEIF